MPRTRPIIAVVFALAMPAAASAQGAQAEGASTLSLSDAEKADLLSHDTEASVDAARSGLDASSDLGRAAPDRAIHGEIGVMAGSHDTHAAYGAATIPLGANARANVSFESGRSNRPY